MSDRAVRAGSDSADAGQPLLATYRLQLRDGIDLRFARELVPYLHELGISHLYLSPIQQAVSGSTHGYDVTDPNALDAALGSEADLGALADALHSRGMGLILDIVPNHVAAHPENPYWYDVLRSGRASRWAHWFDIDWDATDGRLVLPILGERLPEAIASGAVAIVVDDAGQHHLACHDHRLPLRDDATDVDLSDVRAVIGRQHYRLVHWRRAGTEINYRRFFTISGLAALRQEDAEVFEATHARVLAWVDRGWLDGLRLDHVDGLLDPAAYLERLRSAVSRKADAPRPTLHVEKILARDETFPDWPIDGTTGYDFLPEPDDLFIEPRGYRRIESAYLTMLRRDLRFDVLARSAKRRVLRGGLLADVRRLVRMLDAVREWACDDTAPTAEEKEWAIIETIAAQRVYRTYPAAPSAALRPEDRARLEEAIEQASRAGVSEAALRGLRRVLLNGAGENGDDPTRSFRLRFQQLCVPAAAKGVEDTAFYAWAALVCRNEVGSDPDHGLDDAPAAFERAAARRAAQWPASLLTVTTHDTKRTADVRARLAVLSEMADGWWRAVRRWRRWNRPARRQARGRLVPDANMEYLLYQTLVGVWPVDVVARPIREPGPEFAERIAAFMQKAAREAKQDTAWTRRDEAFEEALDAFVRRVLDPAAASPFLTDLLGVVERIIRPGIWNALSRVILHLTAPGVPDLYRGDERWFFALVDPDNRRPVDFEARRDRLAALRNGWDAPDADRPALTADLLERAGDGDLKLHVASRALLARRQLADVFGHGDFARVQAQGAGANHVLAYTRSANGRTVLVVAPRLVLSLAGPLVPPIGPAWGETTLRIAVASRRCRLRCHLAGHTLEAEVSEGEAVVPLSAALAHLPVALLEIMTEPATA